MVYNPKTPTRRILTASAALGAIVLLFVASMAPVAAAEPSRAGPRERDLRPHDRPLEPRGYDRVARDNFTIELDGTIVGRDNATYTFRLDGIGKAAFKADSDRPEKLIGKASVHIVIMDANGTVVKDSQMRVLVRAHEGRDGNWTFGLVSNRWFAHPVLLLRGSVEPDGQGVYELDLAGKMGFKTERDAPAIRGHVEAAGQLVKQ